MAGAGSDLTVLLILKDRVQFTWRWLEYANQVQFPFPILIADGGADPSVEQVLSKKERFPNLDYQYVRYPYDRTLSDYHAKVADAAQRAKTPFVVMAANDDFYSVEGLKASLEFLKANPGYSVSRGAVKNFLLKGGDRVYGDLVGQQDQYPTESPILDETATGRILETFTKGDNTYECVHRREVVVKTFEFLRDQGPFDSPFEGISIGFHSMIAGKVHREPRLFLLRQADTPEGAGIEMAKLTPTVAHWMTTPEWLSRFDKIIEHFSRLAAEADGLPVDHVRYRLVHAFLTIFARNAISRTLAAQQALLSQSALSQQLRRRALGIVPAPAKKAFRLMRKRGGKGRIAMEHPSFGQGLLPEDFKEIERVATFLSQKS